MSNAAMCLVELEKIMLPTSLPEASNSNSGTNNSTTTINSKRNDHTVAGNTTNNANDSAQNRAEADGMILFKNFV